MLSKMVLTIVSVSFLVRLESLETSSIRSAFVILPPQVRLALRGGSLEIPRQINPIPGGTLARHGQECQPSHGVRDHRADAGPGASIANARLRSRRVALRSSSVLPRGQERNANDNDGMTVDYSSEVSVVTRQADPQSIRYIGVLNTGNPGLSRLRPVHPS